MMLTPKSRNAHSMKLTFMLPKDCVITGVRGGSRSKKEVLEELVDVLMKNTPLAGEGLSKALIVDSLWRREEELSTAVGDGFAFPHARIPDIKGSYLLFAVSREGVDFVSPDRRPVNFFFMSIVATANVNLLLQSRAALMRYMLPEENRRKVLDAENGSAVWSLIDKSGVVINKDIVARDIMWPQMGCLESNMTLREAAFALHKYHSDSLPVLDSKGDFAGSVSCQDLFTYGLPEFFTSMQNISFIRHMNPFDKYFQADSTKLLCNLKTKNRIPVLSPESTLIEIIFELAAHNSQFVYIVENKKLLGVIDRFSIVDKILVNSR